MQSAALDSPRVGDLVFFPGCAGYPLFDVTLSRLGEMLG